ncbi:hypothetical protein OH492_17720 [Vibrio chagasii]|nr:hypothetical protein [Vibrio chagasii]
MLENGTIVIGKKDPACYLAQRTLMAISLHVENLLLVDQTQGTLTDNGDNTHSPSSQRRLLW